MWSADVCVIGSGVIGRCAALALHARGVKVALVSRDLPGASSRAAAGLLAPSIEGGVGVAHEFAIAARDFYPTFLESLHSRIGASVEFSREGILDVALDDESEQRLRAIAAGWQVPFLTPNEVAALEPALTPTHGGVLAELDGYIDNVALMDALEAATRAAGPRLREIDGVVSRLRLERDSATLVSELGDRVGCATAVLAAGAWSNAIDGLPRPLPLRPLKGEMIRYDAAPASTRVHRPVYGAGVYIVPRALTRTLVGATSEEAGFDTAVTDKAADALSKGAQQLLPGLLALPASDQWSGLRPMTHDSLPILGTDPDYPALIYACGHSRNGILKAPLTGEVVASLFVGDPVPHDLSPFSPARHESATSAPSTSA
ncbi:MAG: NAD(P)/FAD-dependent oxidoreductase [Gemmatimonadaceae bacterium]